MAIGLDRIQALFCLCFAAFITVASSFLDLEELKNVHYEIDISDKPVLIGRPIDQEVLYLSSKFGQRYECQLPDMSDYEKEQEEEKVASEVGISDLLKPMETAPCLVKTKDWWTYEFCYGQHIKQFHLEGTKQEGIKYLGHYESQMDWSNKTHKDAKRHKLNRYHSHSYINGTECDITGKPREAEVRFICAEGQGDSIDRIDEPSSCVYILTIHTTRICHHPFLRPPPSLKPKPVLCFPALEQDQFEHYTQIQEEKEQQKKEAIARLKAKMKHIKKVSVVSSDDEEDADDDEDDGGEEDDALKKKESPDESNDPYGEEIMLADIPEGTAPDEINRVLDAVLKSVKNAVQSVDNEVQETTEAIKDKETKEKSSAGEEGEDEDEDEDETRGEQILDVDEDEDMEGFTKEEIEEYMSKDYTELVQEFKEGIGGMTDDPAEAARLNALAEELETSFENLEAMDDVISDVSDQLSASGTVDDSGTKNLVEMLSKLIREVLNGPHLKDYMKTYGVYLSTLLEEFRESIVHMTDDPEEVKRLNALADELEMTVRELEEEEADADDDENEVSGERGSSLEVGEDQEETEDEDQVTVESGSNLEAEEVGEDQEAIEDEDQDDSEMIEDPSSEQNFVETLKKIIKEATEKDKTGKSVATKPKLPTSLADDGHVKVRVTRIKLDKSKNKIDLNEGEEAQIFDSNHRKIEDSVKEHLENAGVNVEGGKIEFRILTYTPEEWPNDEDGSELTILSEDESLYFKNMIVSLLGSDAEAKEQTRQSRLETNYHFTWDEQSQGSSSHPVTEATDDTQESETI